MPPRYSFGTVRADVFGEQHGNSRKNPFRHVESGHPKIGWPTASKTFRTKRDAEDWSRRAEDEMVRGVYIQRSGSERMTLEAALKRYLSEVTPTKKPSTQKGEASKAKSLLLSWVNIRWRPSPAKSLQLTVTSDCLSLQLANAH